MAQTIINVKCIDQDLEITSKPLIASGGSNEDVVQWEFSEHWDGFEKTAVFYRAGDDHYHIPVDADNKSVIPHEVTANLGQFIFGVFGVLGDVIRTSEVVSYDVQKGALYSQCNIQNTSPNIYTAILNRLDALEKAPKISVNGVKADENGEIKIEVGSEQLQADFSQNDPTQPDYVKNRTHWSEVVEVPETVLLPETSFTTNEDGQVLYPNLIPDVEVGKEYTVMWNSVEYVTTAQAMEEDGVTMPVLGNFGAMTGGTDTGEPFIIAVVPADMIGSTGVGAIIMPMDGSTELTVSIKGAGGTDETVHKLDNKYLDLAWIPEINIIENEAISETTVTLSGDMPLTNVPIDAFAVGTKLLVVWDGVRYEYTVEAISDGSAAGLFFGSKTGSPFAFLGVLGYPYYTLQAPEGEHTYTIKTLDEVYNVIPDGFLGSSKNVVDLNELGMSTVGDATAGNDIVLNIDTFDYVSALLAGRTLKFKFKVNLRDASNSFRPVDIIAILDGTSAEGLIPNARSYRFSTASITNLGIHVITLDISDGQINASVRRIADTETTTVETTE